MEPTAVMSSGASDAQALAGERIRIESQVESLVAAERARMLFEHTRISLVAKLLFAALNMWLVRDELPAWVLAIWLGMLSVNTVIRTVLDYRRALAPPADGPIWLRRYRWILAGDGLILGLMAFGDYDSPQSALSVMLAAAVVGCEAVAYTTLNVHFKSLLVHLVPALLPMAVWHLWSGTEAGLYLGLGTLMFFALLCSSGWRVYRETDELLRLRYQIGEVAAQRAQALEAAQRSNSVKTRFLAMMSHEIRTPLHGMLGLARAMRGHLRAGDLQSGVEQLETLRVTGEHLITVINDALDLSSLEQRQFQLAPRDFELHALLQDVARIARAAAAEKGLLFELQGLDQGPSRVHGDPSRLRQILLNLTGNAVKFTDQGYVRLSIASAPVTAAAAGPPLTQITVSDSGAGIAAEFHEAIFEPYRRIVDGSGRRNEGTGLGLTIARELARAMGGDLVCDSVPGQGSTFRLSLPLPPAASASQVSASQVSQSPVNQSPVSQSPASQSAISPSNAGQSAPALADMTEKPTGGRQAHVLLVDDNRLNAYVAEFMLTRAGFSFESVDGGRLAVERACEQTFDLILMDCHMPDVDGFEATRRIRDFETEHRRPAVPIVALTANALESDRQRSFDAGMTAHLTKPFSAEELIAVVRQTLQLHHNPDQAIFTYSKSPA